MQAVTVSTDVGVIGTGVIDFGNLYDQSTTDMIEEAYRAALADVDHGITPEAIDAAWVGTENTADDAMSGVSLSYATGLFDVPISRVENACASGSDAFRNAVESVGRDDGPEVALVVGFEKMHDSPEGLVDLATVERRTRGRGVTMPAFFGFRCTSHMDRYGTTREEIAQVSVKNHANGARYPHSHLQFECSVDDVLESPTVTYPLNLYDCCPETDGAAAALVASEDVVAEYTDDPVWVAGTGLATDTLFTAGEDDLVSFPATQKASRMAYGDAGIGPADVDVAEVHDCFSVTELITYEDLGFAAPGEGAQLLADDVVALDGEKPVNPSGGLLAKGHPTGATGVAQIATLTDQLRGDAGPVQVENDPEVALQHNVGIGRNATGSVSCVTILRADA